jgi:hypothetical protein
VKNLGKVLALGALVGLSAVRAEAAPVLQLDIVGGHYDSSTETIVSNGSDFWVIALFTPGGSATYSSTANYYLSAALSPQVSEGQDVPGSYSVNGTTYNATENMVFGVPPLETLGGDQDHDGGDLGQHSVYPTYFNEFQFSFSSANRTATYNTAESGHVAPVVDPTGGSYFQMFHVVLSDTLSDAGYGIHLDLYDEKLRTCARTKNCGPTDIDVDNFAPFSHDAESGPNTPPPPPVPEPATLALLGAGLAFTARKLRRRTATI